MFEECYGVTLIVVVVVIVDVDVLTVPFGSDQSRGDSITWKTPSGNGAQLSAGQITADDESPWAGKRRLGCSLPDRHSQSYE